MKKYLLATCAVALFVVGAAHSADVIETYDPPEVPPVDTYVPTTTGKPTKSGWAGFYIGGQLGGSWADSDVSARIGSGTFIIPGFVSTPLWGGAITGISSDLSSATGGLYAGYNFDVGHKTIISLETDVVRADIDDRTGYNVFNVSAIGSVTGYLMSRTDIEQKWAGATRVRIAYADHDQILPYISAGVAYGKIKSSVNSYLSATPNGVNAYPGVEYNFRDSDTFIGWTVGTGADYAVTDNILMRVEYRYTDYGDKTYKHTIPGGGTSTMSYKVDHRTHDLRLGAAYKF